MRGSRYTLITCEKVIKIYENSELVEWNCPPHGLKSEKRYNLLRLPFLPQMLQSTFFRISITSSILEVCGVHKFLKESLNLSSHLIDCATTHTHFGYLHDYLPQSSSPEEKKFKPRRFYGL